MPVLAVKRFSLPLLAVLSYLLPAALAAAVVATPGPPPPLAVAFADPAFDGLRAYRDVAELVGRFPQRTAGSEADLRAADWVESRFRALGLLVRRQEYDGWGILAGADLAVRRYGSSNVLGISPGERPEAIVVGAHRDVALTAVQGAEDNASGSAALLELARVLTGRRHRYTYVFASFGAEEVGLLGSRWYVSHQVAPTVLAISLDMVGQADGVFLRFGDYDWSQVPLPAVQALFALASTRGLVAHGPSVTPLALTRLPLTGGGSDSAPFGAVGVPALHVSWSSPSYHGVHTPEDKLERISAASLARTGGLIESFVRALDEHDLLDGARPYLLDGAGRFWGPQQVSVLGWLLVLFALSQPAQALLAVWREGMDLAGIWRGALPFVIGVVLLAAALAMAPTALHLAALPLPAALAAWVVLAAFALAGAVLAARACRPAGVGENRLVWRLIALLAFTGMVVLVGPFLAFALLAYHLLVLMQLTFRRGVWLALDVCLLVPGLLAGVGMVVASGALFLVAEEMLPPLRYHAFLVCAFLALLAPTYRARRTAPD